MSHFEGLYCQPPNSKYTMFPTRTLGHWFRGKSLRSGDLSLPRQVPRWAVPEPSRGSFSGSPEVWVCSKYGNTELQIKELWTLLKNITNVAASESHFHNYDYVLDDQCSDKARSPPCPLQNQNNPGFRNFTPGCTDVSQSGGEAPWEMEIHIQLFLSTNMSKFKIEISVHNKPPTSKL